MDAVVIAMVIDRLARLQHGQVATWQLVALGCTPKRARVLSRRYGRSWSPGGVFTVLGWTETDASRTWAAILAVTPLGDRGRVEVVDLEAAVAEVHAAASRNVLATGFTAAGHHDLVANLPTRPQVLIAHRLTKQLPSIRVVRTRRFPADRAEVDGVPTVTGPRLVVDCATIIRGERHGFPRLRRLACRADGRRLLRAEDLWLAVLEPAHHDLPGRLPSLFKRVAGSLAAGHSHSATEALGRRIATEEAAALGLIVEPRPLSIPDEDAPVGEADIAICSLLLDIEVDGPHHDHPEQRRYDLWRDQQLRALGWTVVRFRAEMLDADPEQFRLAVRALLRRLVGATA